MFDILCFCKKHLHIWSLQKSCGIFLTWNQTMKWYKSHKKCPSKHFFLLKRPKIMAVLQMCAKMQFWHWTLLPIITVLSWLCTMGSKFFWKLVLTFYYLCFSKGGLISESKSLWFKSPQKGAQNYLEYRIVIWHFFEPKWKTFWD